MVAAFAPDQLEKSARNLLACAKWMLNEKQARLKEQRPAMKEPEIDAITQELFHTNWSSAYNSLRILERIGEDCVEQAIQRGIAFSALYAFTGEEYPVEAFAAVITAMDRGEITGRPSHEKIFAYLKERRIHDPIKKQVTKVLTQEEAPIIKEEPLELSVLDKLLSPYQTRFVPYTKPRQTLQLMKTPAHLPISKGRRAVVDPKNVLDEESLTHMKIYIVAQASNGKVYVSRQFSWLSTDHFLRFEKEKNKEQYIDDRVRVMRIALEETFKKKGVRLRMSEEILSASRAHIVQFLKTQHYMVGNYDELLIK